MKVEFFSRFSPFFFFNVSFKKIISISELLSYISYVHFKYEYFRSKNIFNCIIRTNVLCYNIVCNTRMQLHRFSFERSCDERSMLSVAFACFLLSATLLFRIQNQLDARGYFVNDIVKWFSVFRVEFSMEKKKKKKEKAVPFKGSLNISSWL